MESTDCATPCICDAGLYHWENEMRTNTKSISRLAGALALAVIGSAVAIPAPATAEERVVNVYNWSDYVDTETIDAFTKETGIKVVYDTYDSDEILETKLLAGKTGYDVVVPGAHFLQRQIKAGVLAKLDKSKLKNLGNLWDEIEKRRDAYDPGAQYSVPYMWGTTAIGINVKKVKERLGDTPLDSWDLLLKPENAAKLKDCGIHILDSSAQILPNILNYAGLNPDSRDEGEIKKAIAILDGIRPSIQKFH
jgi:putrescine transport system substrate-binding protein